MIIALLMLAALQQAEPAPAPVVEKFQIVDPGEMNQRCTSEALVKCLNNGNRLVKLYGFWFHFSLAKLSLWQLISK